MYSERAHKRVLCIIKHTHTHTQKPPCAALDTMESSRLDLVRERESPRESSQAPKAARERQAQICPHN